MEFFIPVVDQESFHENFKYALMGFRKAERDLFQKWADGFVDRDGKIVKEFQTSFNSTFWEVYLYAVLNEYGYSINWSQSSPDFAINANGKEILIEAVIASSAQGKKNEWDKSFSEEELSSIKCFKKLNTEAIIRLSNAISTKIRKYSNQYRLLEHVRGRPFVLAVAPFEQPHFNLQYNRPIRALLYDYYVDEDVYQEHPEEFPNGPPLVNLGFVEKENGAEILLWEYLMIPHMQK